MWRLSGRPDRRVKVENTNVTNLAEKAGHPLFHKWLREIFEGGFFFNMVHVRRVSPERAVTVPEHQLSRLSRVHVHMASE